MRRVINKLAYLILLVLPIQVGPTSVAAQDSETHWKIAVLILKKYDFTIEGRKYKYQMGLDRFKKNKDSAAKLDKFFTETMSRDTGNFEVDTFIVNEPLTSMTSRGNGGYWPSERDVAAIIDEYAPDRLYDSIILAVDMDPLLGKVPNMGWVGLAYASGRPKENTNFATYAVLRVIGVGAWAHEWLHGSCAFYRSIDFVCPDPHEQATYGYESIKGNWDHWYADLMSNQVMDPDGGLVGISKEMYAVGGPRSNVGELEVVREVE